MQQYDTYTDLASEYYDPIRHPTCANFREASGILLFPWLRKLVTSDACVLEVGTGRSIVEDWCLEQKRTVARFIATDSSWEMLRYSRVVGADQNLVVCDARCLPFPEHSFDLVVSSLGDPYNTPSFWHETARVLRHGAHALFSTPAFQWARKFRNGADAAEFSVLHGQVVAVQSYVKSPASQRQLIEDSGLTLTQCCHAEEKELRGTRRSAKLRPGPIVSLYIARKTLPNKVRTI